MERWMVGKTLGADPFPKSAKTVQKMEILRESLNMVYNLTWERAETITAAGG
jgi:hypothetical protein